MFPTKATLATQPHAHRTIALTSYIHYFIYCKESEKKGTQFYSIFDIQNNQTEQSVGHIWYTLQSSQVYIRIVKWVTSLHSFHGHMWNPLQIRGQK